MKFERRRYDQLVKSSNILLTIALILYVIIAFVYFLTIILQDVFFANEINPGFFVFPVYHVIAFISGFISVVVFAILIIKKNLFNNRSIGLEITGIVIVILLHTLFARIMNSISNIVFQKQMPMNPYKYFVLINYLSLITFLVPYVLLLFYIGVTIKMVLTKLNPVEIE